MNTEVNKIKELEKVIELMRTYYLKGKFSFDTSADHHNFDMNLYSQRIKELSENTYRVICKYGRINDDGTTDNYIMEFNYKIAVPAIYKYKLHYRVKNFDKFEYIHEVSRKHIIFEDEWLNTYKLKMREIKLNQVFHE